MKIRNVLAAIAAIVCVAPAGGALAQSAVVRVANLDIGPFVSVAYAEKLAKKHGVEMKITNFRRGLEAAQAVKAGEADVGVGGIEAAIAAIGGGAPAVLVTSVSTGGIAWVGRSDQNLVKIADLKGKKFAVIRGLHELVMLVLFEKNGLTWSTEAGKGDVHVHFINSPPALNVALKARQVDAMSAPEPFPSRAVVEGFAKPMLVPYDSPLGKLPRAVFMRKDFIEKNPAAAQRYVDAVVEATKALRDDAKLARDFAIGEWLKGSMTQADWDLGEKNMGFDVNVTTADVQAYIDYMTKFGMLKTPLKAADAASLGMLEKAKAKAGW